MMEPKASSCRDGATATIYIYILDFFIIKNIYKIDIVIILYKLVRMPFKTKLEKAKKSKILRFRRQAEYGPKKFIKP